MDLIAKTLARVDSPLKFISAILVLTVLGSLGGEAVSAAPIHTAAASDAAFILRVACLLVSLILVTDCLVNRPYQTKSAGRSSTDRL
ncbi:hypothetical protein IWX75_001070 [Arthrobacter sp. CAN_A6]|uniref:hypothetical protein n=1 Tax=Arthrobacter sp. CAN_A6 TaxID=2787721 RepID=UPI0018C97D48